VGAFETLAGADAAIGGGQASRVMKVVQAEVPSTVIAKAVQPLLLKAQVVVLQDLMGAVVGISRTFRLWCI